MANQINKNPQATNSNIKLSPRDIELQSEMQNTNSEKLLAKSLSQPRKSQSANQANINSQQKDESYKRSMSRVQTEMSPPYNLISVIIHNPIIEILLSILAIIVTRPNSMLGGSVLAFATVLSAYNLHLVNNYQLSGTEIIISFAVGWIVGLIYDYFKLLFTGNK